MAGVNVKISADVSSFKKNIQEATGAVKSLDAQLETNEKQLKLNGDAELYMSNKAGLLKAQLEAQKTVVSNTAQALQQMKAAGVDPSSRAFQTMETNLAKAQGKLIDIQTELKNVKSGSKGAETGAKDMNTELKNIGKGVAFQNVTSGLKEITSSLASAGRAAVNFGKRLARSAMDSTEWADDVLTRAMQSGVDAETIQKMDNVAAYIDTDVDTILAAKGRLAKNSGKLSELFGLETDGMSLEDMFWGAGEAIMAMTDEVEQEQAAQEIFGRGWKELIPLFTAGQDEYNRLMEEQNVLSNEQVEKLGEADDKFKQLQQEVDKLKNEFWAENSDKIIGLLQWLIDNKDAVVTAITAIGAAFAGMKIAEFAANMTKAINGFKTLLGFGNGQNTQPTGNGNGANGSGPIVTGNGDVNVTTDIVNFDDMGGAGMGFAFEIGYKQMERNLEANRSWAALFEQYGFNMNDPKVSSTVWEAIEGKPGSAERDAYIMEAIAHGYTDVTNYIPENIDEILQGVKVKLYPEIYQEDIERQIQPIHIPAVVDVVGFSGAIPGLGGSGEMQNLMTEPGNSRPFRTHANGLPYVPYDGYLSVLHRGERVLTASENRNYTYNSNNYFGNVNLNNGQDVDALADAIDRRNRRQRSGYGA